MFHMDLRVIARRFLAASLAATSACTATPKPAALHSASPAASKTTAIAHPAPVTPIGLGAARTAWHLPAARSREVTLAWDGSLVVAGGLESSGTTSSILIIDPSTGAMRPAGRLAVATHDAAGAILQGAAFVFGGGDATTIDAVQRFVPGANARVVSHLPEPRSDLSVAVGPRETYLVGGYDGEHWVPTILATEDGITFRRAGTLAVPVRYAAVAVVDDQLYVFGGVGTDGDVDDIQRLDLASGAVRVVGRLPAPLSHAVAERIDSTIFIVGGRRGDTRQRTMFRYDPTSGAVAAAGALPFALSDTGCATIQDRAFVVGGETPELSSSVVVLRREAA